MFLECYKIKNNFSKSVWLPNKYAKKQDVKPNAYPVFFKRWCANNTYTSYEFYNIDQLNIEYQEQDISVEKSILTKSSNVIKQRLIDCLFQLTSRNAEIFKLRYGLANEKCMTLESIGTIFNISRERVRQIIVKVERRIRNNLKYNPIFENLCMQLNSLIEELNNNSENYIINREIAKNILRKYFDDDNIIFLDLINNLMMT